MVRRSIVVALAALLMLPAAFSTAAPVAAQPSCDAPDGLAPGLWTGTFEVSWQVQWMADLSDQPSSGALAPATWERSRAIRGELDLRIGTPESEGAAMTIGVARATWSATPTATRADGARMEEHESGLLSGGTLTLPTGQLRAVGDAIAWRGAWWTRPFASTRVMSHTVMHRSADGRTVHLDGQVNPRPADPMMFQVTSITCQPIRGSTLPPVVRIAGAADPSQFGYPSLEPEAGLTVVSASARFNLVLGR